MGTELDRRGVPTPLPAWSADANERAPDVVGAIHRDYVLAGATRHTTNTFRTRRRTVGERWRDLTARAVAIARAAVPRGHVVLGSIAPLEDCYRPDLSPADLDPFETRREHEDMARALVDAGVDALLCETFPHLTEARLALAAALSTGKPAWLALTPGPEGTLLTPRRVAACARDAMRDGAAAVLVNCVAAERALPYVEALAEVGAASGVPIGVYANAGHVDDRVGWRALDEEPERAAERYVALARRWVDAGARIVGGCCGTGVAHIQALSRAFGF